MIAFYTSAVTYLLKWFPLDDAVVKDSEFVDFNKKKEWDFSMVCTGTESARFPNLSPIAKLVLTITHSNAGEERAFSVIHKIRCDDRGKLQLITVKLNLPESKAHPHYAFHFFKPLLQQAYKAISYNNKEVCSSKDSSASSSTGQCY